MNYNELELDDLSSREQNLLLNLDIKSKDEARAAIASGVLSYKVRNLGWKTARKISQWCGVEIEYPAQFNPGKENQSAEMKKIRDEIEALRERLRALQDAAADLCISDANEKQKKQDDRCIASAKKKMTGTKTKDIANELGVSTNRARQIIQIGISMLGREITKGTASKDDADLYFRWQEMRYAKK